MKNIKYISCEHLDEAAAVSGNLDACILAGGTDLLGALKDKIWIEEPEYLVSLKGVLGLAGIEEKEDGLHIGAMTVLSDIASSPLVQSNWSALADAAYSVATPNLRNTATIGGNICQDIRCWYYRYPNILGGRIDCARKGGDLCYAMMGENRYHSIFGAAKVCETACSGKCPAKTDIPAYLELKREGDIEGAARIIMEVNPMPAITSRVCAHFCMEECSRRNYDESLNIGVIERYMGDYILEHYELFMKKPEKENGKRAAIVGSGPAGLTAAYYLRESGYSVVIYEKQKEAGGCLTYAIPSYRLPKEIVRKFVIILQEMGITFICNTAVGEDIPFKQIHNENDTVLLDTGTWKRPFIGLAGEELTRFGLDFLVDVNHYILEKPGSQVVVVGGGNVAMDVAITAKRLGSPKVTMVCLEDRDSMPANAEEVERALEEGVLILNGWGPSEIVRTDGIVGGIAFKRCTSVLDESGRFLPIYDDNQTMSVDADIILMAIGQKADLDLLSGSYQVETISGRIKAEENNCTSIQGIFAAGDVTTGPATVIQAIAAGKTAAIAMNEYCQMNQLEVEKKIGIREQRELIMFGEYCHTYKTAQKAPMLPIEERDMHKEDLGGLSKEDALSEAVRCFNCGCLAVNPSDMANMLYAYDAVIVTNQRRISSEVFFASNTKVKDALLPGEIVTKIIVPKPPKGSIAEYHKYRTRKSIDFAIIAVASVYHIEDGRVKNASIVLGAAAPIPIKVREAEEYLTGKELSYETACEASRIALKNAVPLQMNGYKIEMAKVMIRRSLGF